VGIEVLRGNCRHQGVWFPRTGRNVAGPTVAGDIERASGVAAKRVADYRELLRAGRWFRGLPAPFQDALVSMARLRKVATRELLFSRGQPCDAMYAVLEGKLRAYGTDAEGRQALLTIVEPPGWVGEIPFFDGIPRTHDLTADVPSLVAHVPADALLAFLDAEPRYWRDFSVLLAAKLRLAFIAIEDGALSTISQKIARRLVWIADGYGQWTDRTYPVVDVSQGTLAHMLSISRQTINNELRGLEAKGIVGLTYGGVEIKDLETLRAMARGATEEIPTGQPTRRVRR
jgi:CRP/FNR family cyclic AMP-dependent transcriptional regulator